ncbi:MAG TPA: crossover junction endodeoxyribonuclease RuvC [Firmicutes bacterium]|nr:crossover junction endodeoxyribonuclease RuvC [Bacillota bacterium]
MMILGIDPGLAIVGYGIIEQKSDRYIPVEFGAIRTDSKDELDQRLWEIFERLSEIFKRFEITEVAVEELFFSKNAKTAMVVGHARGVVLLTARLFKKPVFTYTPNQIKQAITGYGSAQKFQVQSMVRTLLSLKDIPKPDDAADALACAICHINSRGVLTKIKERK